YADYKINSTVGLGQVYGGCLACHDAGTEGPLAIYNNHDTHHGALNGMLGYQCNYCHVGNPSRPRAEPVPDWSSDPNAYYLRVDFTLAYPQYVEMFGWDTAHMHSELRNSTILNAGDTINGTGCQKCHSVDRLHNNQFDAANSILNEIPGMGHIGNNSDCNGCHAGWVVATDNPFAGATSIELDGIEPGVLTAGEGTEVTITGSNFVQDGFTTSVLIDGVSTAPESITDTAVVVNVNLAVGVHSLQVEKGGVTSELTTVVVVAPGTIASATLDSGVLTIDGAGLGTDQEMVVITKPDGTLKASDSITSSTDAQVVAVSASAAVGYTVTVVTPTGAATAVITAGTQPPTDPVIDSAILVIPKRGLGTLTISGDGLEDIGSASNVYVEVQSRKSTKTYTAGNIDSWISTEIVAKVNTKNWEVGQTVNVDIDGTVVTATITQ
ncbi:hypothetical protein E4H12_15080, partial [Candidatus Thorarchaeota archaeon]